MPEEKMSRDEWARQDAINRITAQIKGIDADIQDVENRATTEIYELEDRKQKLEEELKKYI